MLRVCVRSMCAILDCVLGLDSVVTLSETVVDFTVGVGVSGLCLVRSENFCVSVGGSSGVRV